MDHNVEIKARVPDPERMRARVKEIADSGPEKLQQLDTFFRAAIGRLKLRQIEADGERRAELIAYRRADRLEPTESGYRVVPCPDPEALREALITTLGVVGEVRKERAVYLAGRTRIHLDRVEGLGDFLELEVVLEPGESIATGAAEARALMVRLGIGPGDLVEGAYLDLIAARQLG